MGANRFASQTSLQGDGMQNSFSEVERRVKRYWYSDGIGELVGGGMLVLLGIYFAFQESLQGFLGGNSLVGTILQMGFFLLLFIGGGWINQWLVNLLKAPSLIRGPGTLNIRPTATQFKGKWICLSVCWDRGIHGSACASVPIL
jgi:hypothetical protein